jgi:mono/diheme cytochrome c family protein
MPRLHRTSPALLTLLLMSSGCVDRGLTAPEEAAPSSEDGAFGLARATNPAVQEGREVFRFDDFGNSGFWTDTLRLNELVETISPLAALALGLKVDSDAIPPDVLAAVLNDPALLEDPATTRILLTLDAVLGVTAQVEGDQITRIGVTCAFCHSTVDDAVVGGIGRRLDGWPNRDLQVGTIISATPGLPDELRPIYASWPAGFYDARFNLDGISDPVLIPPAYGLRGVGRETYTGEGPVSYWNNYVAVTQMRGTGSFFDPRLGLRIDVAPRDDQVKKKLPPLRHYQYSLEAPAPPAGFFDPAAAERGRLVFTGAAECSTCHTGPTFTSGDLHDPAATGMDPVWAQRSTTGMYRATPLRALWQHAPYFHDGSAATIPDVVDHYVSVLGLSLTEQEKHDLIEYVKSL